jgi:hypothetical protein
VLPSPLATSVNCSTVVVSSKPLRGPAPRTAAGCANAAATANAAQAGKTVKVRRLGIGES